MKLATMLEYILCWTRGEGYVRIEDFFATVFFLVYNPRVLKGVYLTAYMTVVKEIE